MGKNRVQKTIEQMRIEMDVSQAELAKRIGMTPSNFNKRLSTGKFSYDAFVAIADALGCKFYFYFEPVQAQVQAIENQ